TEANLRYRRSVVETFTDLGGQINGDPDRVVPHTLNVAIPGLDSEAVMLALKGVIAISNGSACTSQRYEPSHVLTAMQLPEQQISGALRISWNHCTPPADWDDIRRLVRAIM
ncbi:MAG: cysteine desulfurase DndA, partial [Candidatus Dormibacteraceae bacterium]